MCRSEKFENKIEKWTGRSDDFIVVAGQHGNLACDIGNRSIKFRNLAK